MNELLSPTVVGRMLLACWKEDRRASCCRIVACAGPHPRSPIINRRPTRLDRRCCQRRPPLPRTRIVIATSATITTTNITTTTTIITITNASRPPLLLPRLLPSRARITLCYRHRRRRPRRRPLFTTFNHGLDAIRADRCRDARSHIIVPFDRFTDRFPRLYSRLFLSFRVELGTIIVGGC